MRVMDLDRLKGMALEERARLEGELTELLEKVASLRLMRAALPLELKEEWERVEDELNRRVLDLLLGLRAFGCELLIVENVPEDDAAETSSVSVAVPDVSVSYADVPLANETACQPPQACPPADAAACPVTSEVPAACNAADDAPTEEVSAVATLGVSGPIATPSQVEPARRSEPQPLAEPTVPEWRDELLGLVREWLPWQESAGEVRRIVRLFSAFESWCDMPTDAVQYLLECAAARIRSLQDKQLVPEQDCVEAVTLLHRIRTRNGDFFVYGLRRDHKPRSGNWDTNALEAFDRLRRRCQFDVAVSWSSTSVSMSQTSPPPAPARKVEVPARSDPVSDKPAGTESVLDAPPVPRLDDDKASELIGQVEAAVALVEEASEDDGSAVATLQDELRHALRLGLSSEDDRLVCMCEPYLEAFIGNEFAALRAAVERSLEAQAEADEDSGPIPANWPLWHKTRKRRAAIVGADPREDRRQKIEKAFEFGRLEWLSGRKFRQVQGLVGRIRARNLDFVIVPLRYVGHHVVGVIVEACKEVGVDYVCIERGYGVGAIQRAIERFHGNGTFGFTR